MTVDEKIKQNDEPYAKLFPTNVRVAALERAHDIRKFEIELYWKRASYFWTIIAVAFVAFFASKTTLSFPDNYIVACLGLAFSLAWYLVNRGGAYWQRNWEAQVDLLEDDITGPLHKSNAHRPDTRLIDLSGPYKFSPSRINAMLSFVLFGVWIFLTSRVIYDASNIKPVWQITVAVSLTVGGIVGMLYFAGLRKKRLADDVSVEIHKRRVIVSVIGSD
jgi:hypothetical protein